MNNFRRLYIESSASLTTALKKMDKERTKLLIVGSKKKFEGLISIGDLQRTIIRNIDLNSPIASILRTDIIVATKGENSENIKNKMLKIRAEFMPVLNHRNEIIDVIFWEDVFKEQTPGNVTNLKLPVVIMAGGQGSRLKPITNILPKALIPVGEKTILEEIMDRFAGAGCDHFLLSVNYKAEMIRHYFENLDKEYKLEYFQEKKPLGTAGSMYLLKDKINSSFFVSNCDILIEQDLGEIYNYHKESENAITIVSALKHYKIPYGTLKTGEKGQLKKLHEKPELTFQINAGMYLLEPECLSAIPKNRFYHITDLIADLQAKQKIGVFPVSEGSWKDIGEWETYFKTINKQ